MQRALSESLDQQGFNNLTTRQNTMHLDIYVTSTLTPNGGLINRVSHIIQETALVNNECDRSLPILSSMLCSFFLGYSIYLGASIRVGALHF